MLQTNNPMSPLFIILLAAVLLDTIFIWSGIIRGQLPNMRTSLRGARIAGVLACFSLIFVLVSYYYFSQAVELFGIIAFAIAFALSAGGLLLAERIPD